MHRTPIIRSIAWLSLFLVVSFEPALAKPPPDVIAEMESLSRVNAALMLCFESAEYKRLSNKEALRIHDLSQRADQIIEYIEKKYSDSNAYTVYTIASIDYKTKPEFTRQLSKSYSRLCALQLVIDAEKQLRVTHSKIMAIKK